jgi:hypothetical protein
LFVGEQLHLIPADGNSADRFTLSQQRRCQHRAIAPAALQFPTHGILGFIQLCCSIPDVDELAVYHGAADHGTTIERQRLPSF